MRPVWLASMALTWTGCQAGAPEAPAQIPAAVEHYRQAQAFLSTEPPKLDEAIRSYTLALQADPNFPQAYAGRARALARRGDAAAAQADLDQAVAVAAPDKTALYLFLRARHWHAVAGDLARAEADYNRAVEWEDRRPDPYLADILMHRALLYLDTQRSERAIADYERVLSLNPDAETRRQVARMIERARQRPASGAAR
jgi:tetratricopeptide (TPR) repeat protein